MTEFHKRFTVLNGKVKKMIFYSFDIETIVKDVKRRGQFLFGGCYNGTDYVYFTDRIKLKNFIIRSMFKSCFWVAHNLEYDLNRIFLDDKHLERYYLGGRLIFAKYPIADGYIYFWDSYNLSFVPLKKLGKIINVDKPDIEFNDEVTPEFIERNRQDCIIVYEYMKYLQNLVTDFGGNMKATLAGISLDVYRRFYMPKQAEYFAIPEYLRNNFRKGYYGGRTEVFNFNEQRNLFYYDINSSYPFSMLNEFPLLDTWKNKPNLDKDGISFVKLSVPDIYYTPLPFRTDDNKLIFPCGSWTGWYYNNELRGIKQIYPQVKFNIIKGIHYTKSFPIFRDYVLDLYQRRTKAKTDAENFIYKILLNSLYGKFAVKNPIEQIINKKRNFLKSDLVSANIIWSGMITAYSRINLLKLLVQSNSLYTDTDSSISKKKLLISDGLGKISIKQKIKIFRAFNSKHYTADGITKLKGVPASAKKIGENVYTYEQAIKYKSALRRNFPLWAWTEVVKEISDDYDKRIKLKSGDTRPLQLQNGLLLPE